MRRRSQTRMIWSSSSGGTAATATRARPVRPGRIRWWLRTGMLLTMLGLLRLSRVARARLRLSISLAGTLITVLGISLPSEPVLIAGFVVLLLALFMPADAATASVPPASVWFWAPGYTPVKSSARRRPPAS